MPISVACKCGKRLAAKDGLAGKKIKCTGCGAAVDVPNGVPAVPPSPLQTEFISVACSCGKILKAKKASVGKRIKCPTCQASVAVSAENEANSKVNTQHGPLPKEKRPPHPAQQKPTKPSAATPPISSVPRGPSALPAKSPVEKVPVGTKKKKRNGPELLIAGGILGILLIVGLIYYFLSQPTSAVIGGTVELDKQLVLMGRIELIAANGKKITTEIGGSGTFVLEDVPFGEATITVNVPTDKIKVYEGRIKSVKMSYLTMRRPLPAIKPANVAIPVEYTDSKRTPFKLNVQGARMEYPLEMRSKS